MADQYQRDGRACEDPTMIGGNPKEWLPKLDEQTMQFVVKWMKDRTIYYDLIGIRDDDVPCETKGESDDSG